MKLRTLFSLGAAVCVASASAATLDSPNTYGILALPDNTSTNLIISVPWVDCANASQNTFVSNVVKTTNLAAGDYLILKEGSTYNSWVLTGTAPDLHWTPQIVTTSDGVTTTLDADGKRIARGMALWLHRATPSTSSPIYLFGQYSTEAATTTITAGQTTMVANPGTSDLLISAITGKFTSGGPANGDKVMVNTASGYKTYTYSGSKSAWTYKTSAASSTLPALPGSSGQTAGVAKTETVTTQSIPAGKGFWYQSKTGAGTITW